MALWPFWKIFKLLWFLADRLSPSCFVFSSSQESLNKNILGSECYSHKQSPRIKQLAITVLNPLFSPVHLSQPQYPLQVWCGCLGSEDRSCWLCASLCVCVLWQTVAKGGTRSEVAKDRSQCFVQQSRLSSRVVCVLLMEDPTWVGSSRVCQIG